MFNEFIVPFYIDEVYQGLAECHGLIKFDGKLLHFEFETRDAVLGIIKSGVNKKAISASEIFTIEIEKKYFGTKVRLILQTNSLTSIGKLPNKNGRIVLKIKKNNYEVLRELVSAVNTSIAELKLNAAEKDFKDRF